MENERFKSPFLRKGNETITKGFFKVDTEDLPTVIKHDRGMSMFDVPESELLNSFHIGSKIKRKPKIFLQDAKDRKLPNITLNHMN